MWEFMNILRATMTLDAFKDCCAKIVVEYAGAFANATSRDYKVKRRGRKDIDRLSVNLQELKGLSLSVTGAPAELENMRSVLSGIEEDKSEPLSKF